MAPTFSSQSSLGLLLQLLLGQEVVVVLMLVLMLV